MHHNQREESCFFKAFMLIYSLGQLKIKMPRTKLKAPVEEEIQEDMPFIPPDTHYLSTKYMVKIPLSDAHLKNKWQLRLYASKLVEQQLRDTVQITSLKIRKPHFIRKSMAKIRGREPCARAYVTIKF